MSQQSLAQPQQCQVLLVDDTPENIAVLSTTLEPEGYRILIANSGEKALRIATSVQPDLIMLDVMMPGLNGFETCRQLKQLLGIADIPVIFCTAKTELEDIVEGFESGGVDYITKPYRHQEVLLRVRTHLQLRKAMQTIEEQHKEMEILANYDQLTRVSNRRHFGEKLTTELERTKRHQHSLSLLFFDIDHFKRINDTYGHAVGDEVLQKTAELVQQQLRSFDLLGRWGGEEFLVMCPETALADAIDVAERIRYHYECDIHGVFRVI